MAEQNEENDYQELIKENSEQSDDNIENEEQGEEKSGAETTSEKTTQTDLSERKLTKEEVNRMGLSKTFIGKPYYDTVEKVNKNLISRFGKQSNDLKAAQTKIGELETKLKPKEVEKIKEEVEDTLPPMPTQFEDPKEFEEWLNKRDIIRDKKLLKALEAKFEESNKTHVSVQEKVSELEKRDNEAILTDTVETKLQELYGDDYSEEVFDNVMSEYESYLLDLDDDDKEIVTARFAGRPVKLANEIIKTHKALNFGKNTSATEKKKEETHEDKVEKLKKKNKLFSQSASSNRETKKPDGENIYAEMIAEREAHLNDGEED